LENTLEIPTEIVAVGGGVIALLTGMIGGIRFQASRCDYRMKECATTFARKDVIEPRFEALAMAMNLKELYEKALMDIIMRNSRRTEREDSDAP
jgi:hypothetical protein